MNLDPSEKKGDSTFFNSSIIVGLSSAALSSFYSWARSPAACSCSGRKLRPSPEVFAGMSPESAWRGYADRLELLLVDFGNRADVERPVAISAGKRNCVNIS